MARGRKPKLDKKMIEGLVRHVRAGNFAVIACNYMNIGQSTYYLWLQKGRQDEEEGKRTIYVELLESIKSAEAESEMRNVNIIQTAARTTWQAAAWYLERSFPQRWGKNDKLRLEHGGRVEIENTVDLSRLSTDELRELERLAKLASIGEPETDTD